MTLATAQCAAGQGAEYEFTRWEERVLEVVMDAMRMSALALMLQALSSCMLGTIPASPLFWGGTPSFIGEVLPPLWGEALLKYKVYLTHAGLSRMCLQCGIRLHAPFHTPPCHPQAGRSVA